MGRKKTSFYQAAAKSVRHLEKERGPMKLDLYGTLRRLRKEKNLSGVELCRRAGDLDPKTLTAVEKGRIHNPSIKTLQSLAKGLGVSVSDLFRQTEIGMEDYFCLGSQKGGFDLNFPKLGVKMVSFTPFMKEFFCGKLIISARRRLDDQVLHHPLPIFISCLIGRFEIVVEDKRALLKEGDNLFFNGTFRHSFQNLLRRDSVLLMVTAPSFI